MFLSRYDNQKKFFQLEGFNYKHLGQLGENHQIIVVYSEQTLLDSKIARYKILRDLGVIQQDQEVYNVSTKDSTESQPSIQPNKLTQDIGVKSKLKGTKYHNVYSTSEFGAFSVFKRRKNTKKLAIPTYFGSDFIIENYNKNKHKNNMSMYRACELNSKGELVLKDKQIIQAQKEQLADILKKNSYSILMGKKFSLPAAIFAPKSNLEQISDFFGNLDFLHKITNTEDKLEKFKFLILFFVSNFYYGFGIKKPLNPYLGETLQGYYPDGTQVFMERISHSPPIDAFYCVNDEANFKFHGKFETNQNFSKNEAKMHLKGTIKIECKDDIFYAELGHIASTGLIYGKQKFFLKDNFYFLFPNANMKAVVGFGGDKHDKLNMDELKGGIFSQQNEELQKYQSIGRKVFKKSSKNFDEFEGASTRISGSWLKSIKFDGKEYWNTNQQCYKMQMNLDVLPSDWRFREDLIWLAYANKEYANEWKIVLEDHYRKERQNRLDQKPKKK